MWEWAGAGVPNETVKPVVDLPAMASVVGQDGVTCTPNFRSDSGRGSVTSRYSELDSTATLTPRTLLLPAPSEATIPLNPLRGSPFMSMDAPGRGS